MNCTAAIDRKRATAATGARYQAEAIVPRLLLGMALVLLAACGSLREGKVDAALFLSANASAPAQLARGRIALIVAPSVMDSVFKGERLRAAPPSAVSVPSGRIVEAALSSAIQQHFEGGAERHVAPAVAGSGHSATVAVTDVQFNYDESLRYLIPIPVPGLLFISEHDVSLQLSFELQMLDERGRPLWSRRYDSGRVLWKRPGASSQEQAPEGVIRLAHEAAWKQAWQAVLDVRAWLEADRTRERRL